MSPPRVIVFRSIFRGRINFASANWLLEESPTHVVFATIPGADSAQLAGPRDTNLASIASATEDVRCMPWHSQRHLWLTPFGGAHAVGHFWDDASGEFLCHYINLQEPLRRSRVGFDSSDHVLDVVVDTDGNWRWKDQDELEEAVGLGLFSKAEARAIREEGERVIATFASLFPTGWESWRPDPSWPALKLPPTWHCLA